jgi:hypothetical protein
VFAEPPRSTLDGAEIDVGHELAGLDHDASVDAEAPETATVQAARRDRDSARPSLL